jgi:hypothetical protein
LGTLANHQKTAYEQYEILKKAGQLKGALAKPFIDYKAFDEHHLNIKFDEYMVKKMNEKVEAVLSSPASLEVAIGEEKAILRKKKK